MNTSLKICFFGIYDPSYSRNAILLQGLRECGVEVDECTVDPREHAGIKKYIVLWKKARAFDQSKYTYVFVGFPGQIVVWLAVILFGRRRIVFDAFLSLYDSNVYDRKLYTRWSLRAIRDWCLDWYSVTLASRVLLDTNAHCDYFRKMFGVATKKCVRVFVGANASVFIRSEKSTERAHEPFRVYFHGTFIPLHGLCFIVDAAKLLEDENIEFLIIGEGQESASIRAQIRNRGVRSIRMLPSMTLQELAVHIAEADVCLGIFGVSEKAARVIPNKVFECAAMGKPVITEDSPAVRELFTDGKDIVLVTAGHPEAIASAIRLLKNDAHLRTDIAEHAYTVLMNRCTPRHIARTLLDDLASRSEKSYA